VNRRDPGVTPRGRELPFYARGALFLVGLLTLLTMLYAGRDIIVPLVFAMVVAIVLHPVVNMFIRLKIPRLFAVLFTLLIAVFLLAAFATLIYLQASRFFQSWPTLVVRLAAAIDQGVAWVAATFRMNPAKIHDVITKAEGQLLTTSGASIGQTIITVSSAMVVLFLIPVYIFLILFYQPLLIQFIRKLFVNRDQDQVKEIITQIKTVIQRYLVGLGIEAALVAILNSAALLVLGIDYAILLGILGAVLNVVPFIGGIVAIILPVMVALATKPTALYAVWVVVFYALIQLVDNHFFVPKVVASKVKINALFSIIVVIAGNALWGIPGMFVSIPLLAIVKLIFDHIEPLKPWGFVLGDTMPPLLPIVPILKAITKRASTLRKKRIHRSPAAPADRVPSPE
jgi:predicted PurR-regulated permease PerM